MTLLVLGLLGVGVVDPATPVASADDAGLTRGDGCFEGCRARRAGKGARIDDLEDHLARLGRSADALSIAYEPHAWRKLLDAVGRAWADSPSADDEAAVKLVLTRGRPGPPAHPTGFVTLSPLGTATREHRRRGVDVVTLARGLTSDAFAGTPWLLGGVKTLSYAVNMAAQREAERRGADDAVFVTPDGGLLEAPTASVVWGSGRTLRTVEPGDNGILASITLARLFREAGAAGFETVAGTGTVADLHHAELALLVSSVQGPVRIGSVDGVALPGGPVGEDLLAACCRFTDFPAASGG